MTHKKYAEIRREIEQKAKTIGRGLKEHVLDRGRLAIVEAPPGSGKTTLLLETVHTAYMSKRRIAVATQTNSQADDICRRMAQQHSKVPVVRFAGAGSTQIDLGASVHWETSSGQLPTGPCVVVGTAAKWGLVTIHDPFDVLFVEEAWQLSWADFMLLGQVSERFVMIGDPGQIPPVVSVDVARWETAPRPPHMAAPKLILEEKKGASTWTLPASRRLPADAVDLVRAFYDFSFGSYAAPGDRALLVPSGGNTGIDRSLESFSTGSVSILTIPTDESGPPFERDDDLARLAADTVRRILSRGSKVRIDGTPRPVEPEDIGLVATHRVMTSALDLALPTELRGRINVDTAERWQGLQRPVMIVVHPLSGIVRPSSFDLETGRLCVMASRHLAAMLVLSRDHVAETLSGYISKADQALGRPDVSGRGHADNLKFWQTLESHNRVVSM